MNRTVKIAIVVAFLIALLTVGMVVEPSLQSKGAATTTSSSQTTSMASASASSSPGPATEYYPDPTFGFAVQVPAGWTTLRDPTPTSAESSVGIIPVLSIHPPEGNGFSGSFVVYIDETAQGNSTSQYYGIYKEKLSRIWSSDGITFASPGNATLGGNPAFVISYVIHMPASSGGDCPERDVVAVRGGAAYIVSLNDCNASEANSHLGVFNSFASDFSFLPD